MRIRVPQKRIRQKFLLIYELEGCQKAVNFLTEHYGTKRMKIVLDGRRVGKGNIALYYRNRAYFTKSGLKRRIVLHELYHHIVEEKGMELSSGAEEKQAASFASDFMRL